MSEYAILRARIGEAAADQAVALGWIDAPKAKLEGQLKLPSAEFEPPALSTEVKQRSRQAQLGQYLTPERVSTFMVGMFPPLPADVQLLDPGAGKGVLTGAFIQRWQQQESAGRIEAHAYELDETVLGYLHRTAEELVWKDRIGVEVFDGDFIERAATMLRLGRGPRYSHAILNPPYRKISTKSDHRAFLRAVGIETVNLYSGFVGLSIALMKKWGEVVAIIPRSFCNGPYYQPFRQFIFSRAAIRHIHLFEARNKAFKNDGVLQENVIIRLTCGVRQGDVTISTSTDDTFSDYRETAHPFESIVASNDAEQFIHIPTGDDASLLKSAAFRYRLDEVGLSVSTGPVVDFRMRCHLRADPEPGTVPLLYPGHFVRNGLEWPKKGFKKANAILHNRETEKLLFPSGFYVVVRRFSSKEERRRIVANVIEPAALQSKMIGFENHLNVLHDRRKSLDEDVARGIAVYLSATVVDQHFRRFNGHTQVNATDLRTLPYPSREALMALGKWAGKNSRPSQETIDARVTELG